MLLRFPPSLAHHYNSHLVAALILLPSLPILYLYRAILLCHYTIYTLYTHTLFFQMPDSQDSHLSILSLFDLFFFPVALRMHTTANYLLHTKACYL